MISAPSADSASASRTSSSSVLRPLASENESGVAFTIPISTGSLRRACRGARGSALTQPPPEPRGLLGALGTSPSARATSRQAASSASHPLRRPSRAPPATAAGGAHAGRRRPGRTARARPAGRAGCGAAARPPSEPRLLAAGREGGLGREVGQVGAHPLRERRRRPPPAPSRRARRGRSAGRGARGCPRPRPAPRAAPPGSTGRPSGISCVRQGASRPSRSTIRSTAILAIRRQVVSLPPVIVTRPELVSYSSALREMSTDFFGSPRRDQRPHAGVGAGQVVRAERGAEERVHARRAGSPRPRPRAGRGRAAPS